MRLVEIFHNTLLILESRVDWLRDNYAEKLGAKFMDDQHVPDFMRQQIENYGDEIGKNVFKYFLELDPDRKKKTMTQWLINLYMKDRIKFEDLPRLQDVLATFLKARPRLPKEQRDINTYKSEHELYDVVRNLSADDIQSGREIKKAERDAMLDEADVLHNSSEYLILTPLTHKAACHFGTNTRWCTATTNSDHYFKHYSDQGPLYIILHKPTNTRWQFHFESNSFMDEEDRQINMRDFVSKHPEVNDIWENIDKKSMVGKIDGVPVLKRDQFIYIPVELGLLGKVGKHNNLSIRFDEDNTLTNFYVDIKWINENQEKRCNGIVDVLNHFEIHGGVASLTNVSFDHNGYEESIYFNPETKKYSLGHYQNSKSVIEYSNGLAWKHVNVDHTEDHYRLYEGEEPTLPGMNLPAARHKNYIIDVSISNGTLRAAGTPGEEGIKVPRELHHYLVDFILKTDGIDHIQDDDSEVFELSDLDEKYLTKLIQAKPKLGTVEAAYKTFGMTDEVKEMIIQEFEDEGVDYDDWHGDNLIVQKFADTDDLIDSRGSDTAQWVKDADPDDFDSGYVDASYHREDLLGSLDEDDLMTVLRFVYNEAEEDDVDMDEFVNPDDIEAGNKNQIVDAIMDIFNETNNDSLDSAFNQAVSDGDRIGAEREAKTALDNTLKDIDFVYCVQDGKLTQDLVYDTEILIMLKPDEIVETVKQEDYPYGDWAEHLEVKVDLDSPQYGWSDYDEDAAKEYFPDCLSNNGVL